MRTLTSLVMVLTVMATLYGQSSRLNATELLNDGRVALRKNPSLVDKILESKKQSGEQQFLLECTLVSNEHSLLKGKKKSILVNTRIVFTQSRPARITSNRQTPFVTGATLIINPKSGVSARQPIITMLETGFAIETKVKPLDDHHVQLDIQIELQEIDNVETNAWKDFSTQTPSLISISRRVVRTVKLGETQLISTPRVGKEKPLAFTYTIKKIDASPKSTAIPTPEKGGGNRQ